MAKDRILYLDIARVIAMLWIVCYWHVKDYVELGETHEALTLFGDVYITDIMLGVFMFLSGFFMSKYSFDNFINDTKSFYFKRIIRFYFLYAISAIMLFMIGFNKGIFTLLTTLTVTSTYLLPQPRTLWFLSMLASFYVFTPLLLIKDCKWLIISFLLIFSGGVILHNLLTEGIDNRFFWCFPLYSIGLFVGKKKKVMDIITKDLIGIFVIVISIIILIKLQGEECYNNSHYLYYLMFPFGIISILYISKLLSRAPIGKYVEIFAYFSMSAYIFHRVIYSILKKIIYGIIGYDFSYLFCFVVFIPTCLIGAYLIQYGYDKYLLPILIGCKKDS